MRLLALAIAALALLAWLRRLPQPEPDRAMDDVQSDPWPALVRDNVVYDPTYLEATTLAIRRSTQSSEVTTEGMS